MTGQWTTADIEEILAAGRDVGRQILFEYAGILYEDAGNSAGRTTGASLPPVDLKEAQTQFLKDDGIARFKAMLVVFERITASDTRPETGDRAVKDAQRDIALAHLEGAIEMMKGGKLLE